MARFAFMAGCASIALFWIPMLGFGPAFIAIIAGIEARSRGEIHSTRQTAYSAIVLGTVGAVMTLLVTSWHVLSGPIFL